MAIDHMAVLLVRYQRLRVCASDDRQTDRRPYAVGWSVVRRFKDPRSVSASCKIARQRSVKPVQQLLLLQYCTKVQPIDWST